ncbi:GrpB family protein [Salinicoccus carnicancri]|uniref:GrpB family protein n=1 Tax=Salinicoccus carnicancri TaxID=558170 RepID=UPI0002DF8D52|nr:GrpB family protein [Salinicoccus carnicancri]
MNDSLLYEKASECYIKATLDILNHYKSVAMEVHHVGSTSLGPAALPGDIDILMLVKNSRSLEELPGHMIEEGYEVVEEVSPYYKGETILRCPYEEFAVNFILMEYGSKRKDDILYCRDCINENPSYACRLKEIKDDYLESRISRAEYQAEKSRLFLAITGQPGDAEFV